MMLVATIGFMLCSWPFAIDSFEAAPPCRALMHVQLQSRSTQQQELHVKDTIREAIPTCAVSVVMATVNISASQLLALHLMSFNFGYVKPFDTLCIILGLG